MQLYAIRIFNFIFHLGKFMIFQNNNEQLKIKKYHKIKMNENKTNIFTEKKIKTK